MCTGSIRGSLRGFLVRRGAGPGATRPGDRGDPGRVLRRRPLSLATARQRRPGGPRHRPWPQRHRGLNIPYATASSSSSSPRSSAGTQRSAGLHRSQAHRGSSASSTSGSRNIGTEVADLRGRASEGHRPGRHDVRRRHRGRRRRQRERTRVRAHSSTRATRSPPRSSTTSQGGATIAKLELHDSPLSGGVTVDALVRHARTAPALRDAP